MTKKQMVQLIEAVHLLTVYFQTDYEKIYSWLTIENPHLGGTTPMNLILRDRGHKLLRFIECQLDEGGMKRESIK